MLVRNKVTMPHAGTGGNHDGWGDMHRAINAAGIPLYAITVNDAGKVFEIQEEGFPDNVLTFRFDTAGNGSHNFNYDTPDYLDSPQRQADLNDQHYNFYWPPELNPNFIFRKINNEIRTKLGEDESMYNGLAVGEWWGQYALHYSQLLLNAGKKGVFFSISSGDHTEEFWDNPSMIEFLKVAIANPESIHVGLHEYSYRDTLQEGINHGLIGRFRLLFDFCDNKGLGGWPKIQFCEWGWRERWVPAPDPAIQQISEVMDSIYAPYHDYIVGMGTWFLGQNYDPVHNLTQQLMEPLTQLTINGAWEVSPKYPQEQPNMKHKAIVVKLPQPHETTEEDSTAVFVEHVYPNGRTATASHDDALNVLLAGNEESFAEIRKPETPSNQEFISILEVENIPWVDLKIPSDGEEANFIDVPILSQRDPQWANLLCGFGPKTIAQWGCLLTVYNMMGLHWGINNNRLVDAENEYFKANGGFSGHNLVSMALSKVYPQSIKDEGWLSWQTHGNRMHEKAMDYLNRGLPVAARVDFKPETTQWEQHWVLLVGHDGTDYLMNDPWTGLKAVRVSDHYGIVGSDILECIFYYPEESIIPPPPSGEQVNIRKYFEPNGEFGEYVVFHWDDGSKTQPQQLQKRSDDVILWKGEGRQYPENPGKVFYDYEQWKVTDLGVQKGVDTSDQANEGRDAYALAWAVWLPLVVEVGKTYQSSPTVTRFNRTDCQLLDQSQTTDFLHIREIMPTWVSPFNSSIQYHDVLVVEWRKTQDLTSPAIETYYFAENVGYVAWNNAGVGEVPQGRTPLSFQTTDCNP